jgi:hypothetical protein
MHMRTTKVKRKKMAMAMLEMATDWRVMMKFLEILG